MVFGNVIRTLAVSFSVSVFLTVSATAQTVAVDPALLLQLQQLIEQQQKTIERLNERVGQLEQRSAETLTIATEAKSTASEAQTTAAKAVETGQKVAPAAVVEGPVVTSGNEKVKLAISGQINRALSLADDGDTTKAYFVDNDVSNSRVRFVGTGRVTENTTLGTTIEVAFSPNNSFDVNQNNESTSDFIDSRKVEAFARNDSYGQILFGKGAAAADDTAEYDLSLVAGPIMYSGVADIVGGLNFTRNGALTGITVGTAFFNFDSGRQNRVRYDSPMIGDILQASVSVGDNDRYDAALTWGGNYGDWTGVDFGSVTTLGAISIHDPNEADVDYRLAGSFSALHNPSGLSMTVSGGMDSKDVDGDPYNLYGKVGWDTSFFDIGPTGFGVDITYGEDIRDVGDKSKSYGFAAIQVIEGFGAELYGQLRYYDLDVATVGDPEDITVITVGTRVKF